MSHIPSIKQFNCNSRVRIAIPLIDNNECEFKRVHGGNCPFKEPEECDSKDTTPSSESNKLRSIISNPTPFQKIAIEKVQNYMYVQAIDNNIQSHISANPSENAEHIKNGYSKSTKDLNLKVILNSK